MVKIVDENHAKLSDGHKPVEIAPAIVGASRALVAALMARVAARGFEGMTPAFAALIPLLDARGARPSVLASQAGVSKQAMSQLIREIESRGYIEQVRDPTDTRAKIVRLNKRGVALRQACAVVRRDLQALAQNTLGEKRVAALQRDLTQLTALLNQSQRSKKSSSRD
jgi:DNA-binding MarR family transcriptional regulator